MKRKCIILAIVVTLASGASSLYLETFHTGIWKVAEDMQHTLNLSLRLSANESMEAFPAADGFLENPGALLVVTAVPDEDWKLQFVNSSAVFTAQEVLEGATKNIAFSGYYWGFTHLAFYLTRNDLDPKFENRTLLRDDLEIVVDRGSMTVDVIFISIGSVLVLFNNINMGAQMNIGLILKVLKKPIGPLCGFLSQFICMPTITWVMGRLLFTDPLYRLGLFTFGCSPGGTSSNFWTLMFNGDINLSITMTAISTIAAMGMMPLWMFTLGSNLLEENDNIQIPFANLAISLVALTVPVCIGIIIRLKRPNWADNGRKVIKPFSLFLLLFFMSVGTYNSYKVVMMMTWQMILAGFLVVICGYTLGAIFAKLFCLSTPQVIAVSIETALQNPGVAFILLKLSIESPYSDLASVPIMAALFVSGPPLVVTYFLYQLAKKCCGCCKGEDKETAVPPQTSPEEASFIPVEDSRENGSKPNEISMG